MTKPSHLPKPNTGAESPSTLGPGSRPKLEEEINAAERTGRGGTTDSVQRQDEAAFRCARSDEESDWFAPLVRSHSRRVFGLLYRMVGNAGDAQDLAQDVFLKAWLHREQLRDPARATPWLLRIAANAAIDFQRSRLPHRTGASLDDEGHGELRDSMTAPGLLPEAELLQTERHRRLWAALKVLSPKERASVVMRDLEGMPNQEVAAALGCSMITVRTHIASARIKMRKHLLKEEEKGK